MDSSALEATYCRTSLEDWQKNGHHQAAAYGFSVPCLMAVGDASMVRRSSSRVVDGLRYCHTQSHEVGGRGIVVGHQYQLLRYIAEPYSSWALPLMHDRLGENDTAVALAAKHVERFSKAVPKDVPCLGVYDGGYGNARFLAQTQQHRGGILARMRSDRALFHAPPQALVQGRGAPKRYGEAFDGDTAATDSLPDDCCQFSDLYYGLVLLQRWNGLLIKPPPNDTTHRNRRQTHLKVDVLRCTVRCERQKPTTLWLVFQANGLPPEIVRDTIALWRTFDARAGIEASIKVSKQECSWTMPQTLSTQAADRWTHLTDIAFWHLFLARRQPNLVCHPWQNSDAPITPRRVRQSMAGILLAVGTPAKEPRLRGKSPGWQEGRRRTKKKPVPVIYKGRKKTKKAVP